MFDAHLETVASRYGRVLDEARHGRAWTETNAEERYAWRALADDSVKRAEVIRTELTVIETDHPEPYPDAATMTDGIRAGIFYVSRAHCAHPIWTPEENVAFRIVHDVIGHGRSGGAFDWEGENRACETHAAELSIVARYALFTECIAQTGFAIARGGFGPQVCKFLDGHPLPLLHDWGANA